MLICANESYKKAENDLAELALLSAPALARVLRDALGIKISHSTLHRLVQRQDFELPTSVLGVKEVTVDGGKVRIRTEELGHVNGKIIKQSA